MLEAALSYKWNPCCPCSSTLSLTACYLWRLTPSVSPLQLCYCTSPVLELNKPVYLTLLLLSTQVIWHVVVLISIYCFPDSALISSLCAALSGAIDVCVDLSSGSSKPGLGMLSMSHMLCCCSLFTEAMYYAYCKRAGNTGTLPSPWHPASLPQNLLICTF